jgi:hypothetical protein
MPALGPPKLRVGPVFGLFGCGDAVERLFRSLECVNRTLFRGDSFYTGVDDSVSVLWLKN